MPGAARASHLESGKTYINVANANHFCGVEGAGLDRMGGALTLEMVRGS